MEFRSDIIDIHLILRALKSLHKGLNAEMKINSFQSLNATAKGENFLGDLAALEVFARIEQGNQIQYRTFLWMVKMLKPNAGKKSHSPSCPRFVSNTFLKADSILEEFSEHLNLKPWYIKN